MKIAQIGTGYWGRNHARVWKELKTDGIIEDVILVDINEKAVKPLAENLGLEYLTSPEDIPEDVDAIDIVAPTPLHFPLSKKFMEKGKHILVEKPMTSNSKEGKELVRLAEETGLILMPGHLFRYHPALNEMKKMVSTGRFGRVFYLKTIRSALRVPRKDMGVLLALAIHDVDIYSYILKKDPKSILCSYQSNFWEGIDDVAQINLDYGGTWGYIFESWLSPVGTKIREIQVVGDQMSARIDYLKPDIVEIYDSGLIPENGEYHVENEGNRVITIPYKEPLRAELEDFIKSIESHKQPVADMYSGLKAVEIIENAMESAKKGERIHL
jgi:UDP-N-acetylglucosamine 3-dehydrogenase